MEFFFILFSLLYPYLHIAGGVLLLVLVTRSTRNRFLDARMVTVTAVMLIVFGLIMVTLTTFCI